MITNLLLDLVHGIINLIDSFLPHFAIPAFLTAGNLIPSASENLIASAFVAIAPIFPSQTALMLFVAVLSLWPPIALYVVFDWVYRHMPTIAGFGPGNG